ncbi:MAG: formate/nitrite transporter family protein [Candidatus Riflebacteria bacterium]|nr:formate/nitrite transporter family protein [Candidatus Riflebacteria bacterium]
MHQETLTKLNNLATAKRDLLNAGRGRYFVLAMLAGFYVGLGIILILTIGGQLGADPIKKTLMGVSFGIALSLVIMAGSELFTGNNMIMAAASLDGKVSWSDTIRIWSWSWFGNWAGSILVSVLFVLSGQAAGSTGVFAGVVSAAKMGGSVQHLFFQGFLCNILVCLAVLCAIKLKEETAKLIMIWWCLFAFITSGFEHSIANMTVLTIGLLVAPGTDVTMMGYLYNLGVVGLGNLFGGALILGGGYWLAGRCTTANDQSAVCSVAK